MNDKYFDSFIKNHYPKSKQLEMSDEALKRIMQLNKNSNCTKVARRIVIMRVVLLLVIALVVPTTVYAASRLYSIVYEKVKNADMSEEEISYLANELDMQEFSSEDIEALDSLQINEYGQTYGPDALGADLVEVESDNGKHGYVYRDELEQNDISTPKEALKNNKAAARLKVYKSDGRTVIGYFTLDLPMENDSE